MPLPADYGREARLRVGVKGKEDMEGESKRN